jgi:acetyltransferase-like isoleucine patch superfamily enzyme
LIHKLAEVHSDSIGEGTYIWQFSIVLKGAIIGHDCNINCHTLIEGDVVIGDRVTIKSGVYVWNGITIGDDVMVGPNVTFTNDKWPKSKNSDFQLQRTLIQKGASIGAAATILGGVVIGQYALIAANSLVTKDVPDRALMKGSPAVCVGWMNEYGMAMIKENEFYKDSHGQLWRELNNHLEKL